jgi:hypothetical protein
VSAPVALPPQLAPNALLVARDWLRASPRLAWSNGGTPVRVGVATSLPKNDDVLRSLGFIRLTIAGGSPDVYVPRRNPVITAECWAAPFTPGSEKLPWDRAGGIAELVWESTFDRGMMNFLISPSLPGYLPARVRTVEALTEPRDIHTDPNYARFDVELLFHYLTEG